VLEPASHQQEEELKGNNKAAAPSSSNSSSSSSSSTLYKVDRVLFKQEETGVHVLLAYPVAPEDTTTGILAPIGDRVVIKVVPKPSSSSSNEEQHQHHHYHHQGEEKLAPHADSPLSEIAAMQLMMEQEKPHGHHHPRVIHLIDCMQDETSYYIVLPYLANGDLFARVQATGGQGMAMDEVRRLMIQMVEGLLMMKQCHLAHRDVSLENFMFTDHHDAQVIDLGMALRVPEGRNSSSRDDSDDSSTNSTSTNTSSSSSSSSSNSSSICSSSSSPPVLVKMEKCCGKPGYISPQMVRAEEPFDPYASDMWSLGVCLYMMATGQSLYEYPDDDVFESLVMGGVKQVIAYFEERGTRRLPRHAKDLICRMLDVDPLKRPTLENILSHPFFHLLGPEQPVGCLVFPNPSSKTLRKSLHWVMKWTLPIKNKCHTNSSSSGSGSTKATTTTTTTTTSSPHHQQ